MDGFVVEPIPREPAALRELTTIDWNLEELLERVEGDRQLMLELLGMFRNDSPNTMEMAREALRRGDLHGLSRVAHGMKGMLKNLAMGTGSEIAGALEKAAGEESLGEVEALLQRLERALAQIMPEVEAQMTGVKA